MATVLTQGTKEYLVADVSDAMGELTSLDGTAPRYDVFGPKGSGAPTQRYNEEPATLIADPGQGEEMRVLCMIDTNLGSTWPGGVYQLYLKFDTLPEIPRVGPFEFNIIT